MESRKITGAFLIVAIISPIMITCQSRGEQYRGQTSTNNGYLRGLSLSQSQSQYQPNQEYYQQQSQVQSFSSPIYKEPSFYNPSQQYSQASPPYYNPQSPPPSYNTPPIYNPRPQYPAPPPQYQPQPPNNPAYTPQNNNNKPYDQSTRYPQSQTQSQQTYIQQAPIYNRPSLNARPESNTHFIPRPTQTQNYNNVQSQQNPHSTLDSRFGPEDSTTPEVFTNRPTRIKVRPPTPTSSPPDFHNRFDDRDSVKKKLSFDADLSTSMEVFGLELLQQFNARFPEDNFMISPFSVYHLLVLIAEGAQGTTFAELNRELNLKTLERTRDFQQYLSVALSQNTADVVLKKFAMLVTDLNRPIENAYETTLDKVYDADVVPVNFLEVERTLQTINGMVSNLTGGQIRETVEKDDLLKAQLILISGLFFQGKWANIFNTTFTKPEQFYDTNGNQIGQVNMMFQRGPFAYSAVGDLGCHVLELPYAEAPINSRNGVPTSGLSMILVLPRKGLALDDAIVNVHKHGMDKIYRELYNSKVEYEDDEVEVHLPRFEITTSLDIKETLSALGINEIFDQSRADLSKINKKSFVSSMIHKTKISVDEKGTTAAAVTTSIFANKATPPKFHANKPFLFFIVDKVTKLILFSGQYAAPELF